MKQLKQNRTQMGMKIRDVAVHLGIDAALVSKFESGQRIPTKAQVIELARILNIDQQTLLSQWLRDKILLDYGHEAQLQSALGLVHEALEAMSSGDDESFSKELENSLEEMDLLLLRWKGVRSKMHKKMMNALMTEYTFESNRIEGNTLTLQETDLVVNHGLTISGKTMREHLEAINHQHAIDFVKTIAQEKKPISERDIMQIHSLVLRGIDPEEAGRIRRHAVIISGARHVPPPPEHLREELDSFMKWYKRGFYQVHPVLFAADVHHRFVSIHPFIDGNGRTSRLLMNLHLLQHGYPIANISGEASSRLKYYDALEGARNEESLNVFRELIIDALKISFKRWLEALA
jgi:Fic family protein